jgi:DNA-binding CsgD family transcriptional regulator
VTSRPQRRAGPIRVVLYVADRALRADIADTCKNADIAVAAPPLCPPSIGGEREDGDVALADWPIETTLPVIALGSRDARKTWPANVRAVAPTDVDAATLVAIITVVAAGYVLVPCSDLTSEDISKDTGIWADPADAADDLAGTLTPREREVLAFLAEGASNKEIARALALSVHTVKFHVASIMEKLGARSRVEAVAIAMRVGLTMV